MWRESHSLLPFFIERIEGHLDPNLVFIGLYQLSWNLDFKLWLIVVTLEFKIKIEGGILILLLVLRQIMTICYFSINFDLLENFIRAVIIGYTIDFEGFFSSFGFFDFGLKPSL